MLTGLCSGTMEEFCGSDASACLHFRFVCRRVWLALSACAPLPQINGQTQAVEAALTIDETKFLGGDVEHTHLVKGLDYALLAKVPPGHVTPPCRPTLERSNIGRAWDWGVSAVVVRVHVHGSARVGFGCRPWVKVSLKNE